MQGIGDDCAVLRLPRGHEALVTTDFSLEGVHFRREWHPPESAGHRCLTRGLSDIAAMGGVPLAVFLSLALPENLPQRWVNGFLRGFRALARKFNVQLAGGDTAQSPSGVLADIMVVGSVPAGKAVLRSGARAGDDIYVTGALGGSAAALHRLRTNKRGIRPRDWPAHFFPTPRVAVGRFLRENHLASAMIDISDGLSTDLAHICEESRAGAWLAQQAIPAAKAATLDEALHGGDDYELLFTAPAAKHDQIPDRIASVPIRWIGTITKPRGLWLVDSARQSRQPLAPRGWEHFRQR